MLFRSSICMYMQTAWKTYGQYTGRSMLRQLQNVYLQHDRVQINNRYICIYEVWPKWHTSIMSPKCRWMFVLMPFLPTPWIIQYLTWRINSVHVAPCVACVCLRVTNICTQRVNIIICNYNASLYGILSMTYCYWMTFRDVLCKEIAKSQTACKIPVGLLGPENQLGCA